jgi:GTP-binding protein
MTPIAIEEPTVRMSFAVNKSPFAGKDPKSSRLTSRMIRDRLYKVLIWLECFFFHCHASSCI